MGFEVPESTVTPKTPDKPYRDAQELGTSAIQKAESVFTATEKEKKFEGLTKEQEDILKANGVADIRPDKSPKGHDSTALRFSPDAELAVMQANGRWISVPNTTIAHITHFDTTSVEVTRDQRGATLTIHNKDGSTEILRTWLK